MRTERDIQNQIAYAREEGREEGRKEGLLQVARAMLEQGIDKEYFVDCIGLSLEEVERLQK